MHIRRKTTSIELQNDSSAHGDGSRALFVNELIVRHYFEHVLDHIFLSQAFLYNSSIGLFLELKKSYYA